MWVWRSSELGMERLGVGMEKMVIVCAQAKAFGGLGVENTVWR